MRIQSDRIEQDRVRLFEAWEFFRGRLRQQRGERKRGVQQSLLPMLEQMLLEVKEGFQCEELWANVNFGRVEIHVRLANGQEYDLAERKGDGDGSREF